MPYILAILAVAAVDSVAVDSVAADSLSLPPAREPEILREIVVTARESLGATTSSRIDRAAMEHLQPTSFTDLLELLPGNISQNPNMGSANNITLRETGGMTATGGKSALSDDYAITSLGTAFVVDGAPMSGDANLSAIPTSDATDASAKRSSVNRGVDMRALSTDNIESVEVIRGIPSAEYGNLTSGVVNIRRISRATPVTARFKADEYSKLFSVGKGFALPGHDHVVNVDAGYLDSRIDPRDRLENYKRVNASLRAKLQWIRPRAVTTWNVGADYTGSFDNAKVDPDLNYNRIDLFKSKYNRAALTSRLSLKLNTGAWFRQFDVNASVAWQHNRIERQRQVAPQRASIAPTTMAEGVHRGRYLLGEYIADYLSDGKPVDMFVKLTARGQRGWGVWDNKYMAGAEYTFAKNYGRGEVYDLERPLSASWTTRPRAFSDIPSLQTLSFYAEDAATLLLGAGTVELHAGLRTIQLPGLASDYRLSGKVYLDPRVNLLWRFGAVQAAGLPLTPFVAGGYGLTTRMPTVDYLFPQVHYNDMIQLNYYNTANPAEWSLVSLRTCIEDAVNHDLEAARNSKWEVRTGFDWGANRFAVTYFREHMSSGFRYQTVYRPYTFTRYDASAVSASREGQPDLSEFPGTEATVLDGMRRVTNGSRIDKQGVEFQLNTARWNALRTSLIVTGAWFRTRYSNSQMLYQTVNDVVGSTPVSDMYVGLYDVNDGRINEQFNTNFTFDTQIPRWNLVFTTSLQCMWWMKTTRLWQNGVPAYYMSAADGQLHPYTEADRGDVHLQYLVKKYNDQSFATQKVPTALYLNLKVTKKIGRWLKVSAFVNRIVDYLPDYKSNGLTIRRASDSYFGMEAVVTI